MVLRLGVYLVLGLKFEDFRFRVYVWGWGSGFRGFTFVGLRALGFLGLEVLGGYWPMDLKSWIWLVGGVSRIEALGTTRLRGPQVQGLWLRGF